MNVWPEDVPLLNDFALNLRRARYFGNRYHCTACGAWVRVFLNRGNPPRPAVQCPVCGSLERNRFHAWLLEERGLFGSPLNPVRLLFVHPDSALLRRARRNRFTSVITMDLHGRNVDVQADIQNLPFEDACFDVVVCSHVLEHVADDRKALAEIRRVLDPEGTALVAVPIRNVDGVWEDPSITDPEERRKAFGEPGRFRAYSAEGMRDRMIEAGFDVEWVQPPGDPTDGPARRMSGEPAFLGRPTATPPTP